MEQSSKQMPCPDAPFPLAVPISANRMRHFRLFIPVSFFPYYTKKFHLEQRTIWQKCMQFLHKTKTAQFLNSGVQMAAVRDRTGISAEKPCLSASRVPNRKRAVKPGRCLPLLHSPRCVQRIVRIIWLRQSAPQDRRSCCRPYPRNGTRTRIPPCRLPPARHR